MSSSSQPGVDEAGQTAAGEDALAHLRRHLVSAGLAGSVATSPQSTLTNCGKLLAGDDRYHFGLSDWRTASFLEAVEAVRRSCGGDPGGQDDLDGPGFIDPDAALSMIELHRTRLRDFADHGGGRVLLATGHPTGLLPHYGAIARGLQAAGAELLAPLDDVTVRMEPTTGRKRAIRFLDAVACITDGGSLLHSHRSDYMEAMLSGLGGDVPDLVVADHGMAGAAVEAGIPTLSIADVNDPALMLAQARDRTDAVLPIDDNLAPRLFVPVTGRMLDWSR